ncbi:hypothetical protein ACI6PS_12515 [Flavobacterium sp. PLA-1-15]|uniref:hypothetical protein n=1 Tax=Flavobacterium sp. PLA-1-15 TaxID=3380533 RepID=UPI003B7CFCEB
MKKISLLLLFLSAGLFLSCEEDNSPTVVPHISFENDGIFGFDPGATTATHEIKVYATQASGSDRVYSLVVNPDLTTATPSQYTLPASVTIPANSREGSFTLTMKSASIGKVLAIDFVDADFMDGTFKGAAPLMLTPKVVCPTNDLVLELILDQYGQETVWELYEGTNVVASGGPYTQGAAGVTQPKKEFSFCLPDGDYKFVIYDLYGDGMNSGAGAGSFLLRNVGTGKKYAEGGTFTDMLEFSFSLPDPAN